MAEIRSDLFYAVRRLRKTPMLAIVAVVTIGLGIGVNTAVFGVVNGVLLKPHVSVSDRVVKVSLSERGQPHPAWMIKGTQLRSIRSHPPKLLRYLSGVRQFRTTISVDGESRVVHGEAVFGDYFRLRGGRPLLGRTIADDDGRDPDDAIVIISERLWRHALSSDAQILGRALSLGGQPYTIVGVLPSTFRGLVLGNLLPYDVWVARGRTPGNAASDDGVAYLMAEIADGATFAQADAETRVVGAHIDPAHSDRTLMLQRLSDTIFTGPPVFFVSAGALLLVSALVFSIAGLNLTNLLITSLSGRTSEIAVRQMLGADRKRLFQLLGIETAVIALMGLGTGLLVSRGIVQLFMAIPLERAGIAPLVDTAVDWRVLCFALLTAVIASVAVTAALVARASSVSALSIVSAAGGAGGATRIARDFRTRLVAFQVSGAVAMLVCAALVIRATVVAVYWNPGYDADGVAVGRIDYSLQGRLDAGVVTRAVLDEFRQAPNVLAAAAVNTLPGKGEGATVRARASDAPVATAVDALIVTASPALFDTVGLKLVAGRDFRDLDAGSADPVAIISQGLGRRLWSTDDAVGRQLLLTDRIGSTTKAQVIGVSSDVLAGPSVNAYIPFVVIPLRPKHNEQVLVAVRGAAGHEPSLSELREVIKRVSPDLVVQDARSLAAEVAGDVYGLRLLAVALSGMGSIGGLIALFGVFSVTSYTVSQRKREFGIRMAVGATHQDMYRVVMRETVPTLGIGVLVGTAIGLPGCLLIRSLVRTPVQIEIGTVLFLSVTFVAVGLLAAVAPLYGVLRQDPYGTLRT